MHDLLKHKWLRKNIKSPISSMPLRTPGVLSSHNNAVKDQINCTMEAFHQATRDGFRLQEVATAPLAKRRKQKKNSLDRSSSTDSNNSSSTTSSCGARKSPVRQSPVGALSRNSSASSISQSSVCSMGFVPNITNNPSPLASMRSTPDITQTVTCSNNNNIVLTSTPATSHGFTSIAPQPTSQLCSVPTPISPIHIPSVDSVEDVEDSTKSPTVKGKRGSRKNNNNIIPPSRLTRGQKRKMESSSVEEDDNNEDDCVIVERNYLKPGKSAFKRLKSETIVID